MDHEAFFSNIFNVLPTPFMVLDREMRFVGMNEAYLEITCRTREGLLGKNLFDAFPEIGERRNILHGSLVKALSGTRDTLTYLPYSIADDSKPGGIRLSYWNAVHTPLRDKHGEVTHVVQQTLDVTEQYKAEQRNKVLTAELDHRVKNILAIVSTIGRRTARHAPTMQDFLKTFDNRLQAMARTHSLLAEGRWDGTTLEVLFRSELEPYGQCGQIKIQGPHLILSAQDSQTLSMAIHELTTNASKYGALSVEGGTLNIEWTASEGGYRIAWSEHVPEGVSEPARKSFGSAIIDDVTPKQLNANVERIFTPTGLLCTIEKKSERDASVA